MKQGKVIILSAPSGSGKTTIVNQLLKYYPEMEFSISATSRAPRGEEMNGREYHFFSPSEFMQKIEEGAFLEWEEVYEGTCYGTLNSEIARIWRKGNIVLFDVDVVGGVHLKQIFGDSALSLFIMPPSIEELRRRLEGRATDTTEAIERRLAKAKVEISYAEKFDHVLVNDDLESAVKSAKKIVQDFFSRITRSHITTITYM